MKQSTKEYIHQTLPMLLIFLLILVATAKTNYNNGQISMCRDLGGELAIDTFGSKKCITGNELDAILSPKQPSYGFGVTNGTILQFN